MQCRKIKRILGWTVQKVLSYIYSRVCVIKKRELFVESDAPCFFRTYSGGIHARDAQSVLVFASVDEIGRWIACLDKKTGDAPIIFCLYGFENLPAGKYLKSFLFGSHENKSLLAKNIDWHAWAAQHMPSIQNTMERLQFQNLISRLSEWISTLNSMQIHVVLQASPSITKSIRALSVPNKVGDDMMRLLSVMSAGLFVFGLSLFCYEGYAVQSEWHEQFSPLYKALQTESVTITPSWFELQRVLARDLEQFWYYRMIGLLHTGPEWNKANEQLLQALEESRAKPLKSWLEQRLHNVKHAWRKYSAIDMAHEFPHYYRALRDYLWLTHQNPEDIMLAAESLNAAWRRLALKSDANNTSVKLWNFYLLHRLSPLWGEKKYLVHAVRKQLKAHLTPELRYKLVQSDLLKQLGQTSLTELAGWKVDAQWVAASSLPTLYLASSFSQYVDPALSLTTQQQCSHDWVLGVRVRKSHHEKACEKRWHEQLKSIYLSDTRHAWQVYMTALTLKSDNDLANTQLMLEHFSHKLSTLTSILSLLNHAWPDAHAPSQLRLMLLPKLIQYQKSLKKVADSLDALQKNGRASASVPGYLARIFQEDGRQPVIQATHAVAALLHSVTDSQLKSTLEHILMQPLLGTVHMLAHSSADALQSVWETKLYSVYQEHLMNRFPLSQKDALAASPSQFASFFHPKYGVLWEWLHAELGNFLRYEGGWKATTWHHIRLPFSSEFLMALNQTETLTSIFFQNERRELGFPFSLSFQPEKQISSVELQLGETHCRFENGPTQLCHMRWLPDDNSQLVELQVDGSDGAQSVHYFDGWGLVRLLRRASWRCMTDNECELTWSHHARALVSAPHLSKLKGAGNAVYFPLWIFNTKRSASWNYHHHESTLN